MLFPLLALLPVLSTSAALAAAPSPQLLHAYEATPEWVQAETAPSTRLLHLTTPDGEALTLVLQPNRVRDDGIPNPPSLTTWAGYVEGRANSWVRLSQIGEAWSGVIHTDQAHWFLDPSWAQPAQARIIRADKNSTLIYSSDDIEGLAHTHDDSLLAPVSLPLSPAWSPAPKALRPPYYISFSIVLDTEFQ